MLAQLKTVESKWEFSWRLTPNLWTVVCIFFYVYVWMLCNDFHCISMYTVWLFYLILFYIFEWGGLEGLPHAWFFSMDLSLALAGLIARYSRGHMLFKEHQPIRAMLVFFTRAESSWTKCKKHILIWDEPFILDADHGLSCRLLHSPRALNC